jgi:hypothetical protein
MNGLQLRNMKWLAALGLVMLAGLACKSQVEQIQENCTTAGAFDISGGFEERFNCDEGGVCVDQDVTIYLQIDRDTSDTDTSDGTDYTFCETGGLGPLCIEDPPGTFKFSGEGTLCGATFAWNGVAPGSFTESGIWQFSNGGDTFLKSSTYQGAGSAGVCRGAGRRGGGADAPPASGACP